MLFLLTYVFFYIGGLNAILYDCFTGKPVNKTQLRIYEEKNITEYCTIDIKPCNPEDWSRIDGSCNNLKYPSRGTPRTPPVRLLTPVFSPNYEPRKSYDGGPLAIPRKLRCEILPVGKLSEMRVTQLVSYYLLFSIGDVNSIHDIYHYLKYKTHCCEPQGRKDYMCTPNEIPTDDPVHRFSGVTCMNLTRPISFQTYGCLNNRTTFSRIVLTTPNFDLSNNYDATPEAHKEIRTYKEGLLKMEEDNGLLFPPTDPNSEFCFANLPPRETRCHKYQINAEVSSNFLNILFYRLHNHIAKVLRELNPCWDDNQLFFTARDINIAISLQIYFYELLPIIFGRRNMVEDGLISCNGRFRDIYDENIPPQMSDEYTYMMRWFHTIQETNLKFYDKDGCFVKTYPFVNCTARTGFLAIDDNMVYITQGSFRQPGGKFDQIIDPDMVDKVFGNIHYASDVATSDLYKGRLFGFQPYIKYREFCEGRSYKSFSDLKDVISPERIYRLKQLYKHPEDIDLMAGVWVEKNIRGGRVPHTLYCLIKEQLRRSIISDRHWFERPNRPHAFTWEQLKAIRTITIASVLCTVGDSVTQIQPNAFYTIYKNNPLTNCSAFKIGISKLAPWKDLQCEY